MSEQQYIPREQLISLLGRFWTIPNMLSLIRLVLIFPITYLILEDGPIVWLLSLVALAIFSDWLDGYVARWFHTESSWGKVLDPLADKMGAAMIVTALTVREAEPNLPLWFLLVIVVRDLCIVLGGVILAKRTGHVAMSTWTGKVAATFLAFTMLAGVLRADQPLLEVCVWITTALLLVSFLLYTVRFVRLFRKGSVQQFTADPHLEPLDSPDRTSETSLHDEAQSVT